MTAQANSDGMNLDYPGASTSTVTTLSAPQTTATVQDPQSLVQPLQTDMSNIAPAVDPVPTVDEASRGQQVSGPSFDTVPSPTPVTQITTDTPAPAIDSLPPIPDPAVDPAALVPPVAQEVVANDQEVKEEKNEEDEKESPLQALARKLAELKSELIEETPDNEAKDSGEKTNDVSQAELPLAPVEGKTAETVTPLETPATLQVPLSDKVDASEVTNLQAQVDPIAQPIEEQTQTDVQSQEIVEEPPVAPVEDTNAPTLPTMPAQSEPSIEEIAQQTIPTPEVLMDPVAMGTTSSTDATAEAVNNDAAAVPQDNTIIQPIIEEQMSQTTSQEQALSTPVQETVPMAAPTAPVVEQGNLDMDENDNSSVNTEVIDQNTGGKYPLSISKILDAAIERNASDVHVSVGYPVMLRIDGTLVALHEQIVSPANSEELILPVLSDQKKELLEVNREVDLAYTHRHGGEARFRINAFYTRENLSAAFRLIPTRIKTIEELKLPPIYTQFANLKQGLVLVTGPTGHGKSTTLAAILQHVNLNRSAHVLTIEDPIEYIFPKAKAIVDQREMHDDTHSWTVALKSALRQDPDVILVGEMRDYETIASTITLAETGHLVFATLHTNSAAQTIDRIIDVFPENQQAQVRAQLANILEAVIAQRLIPVEGGGRRAVSEIMLGTPAIRNLIREGKTHQLDNVIRTSADVGMVPLEQSLVKLVREGLITMDKAEEYAVHPEEVVRLLKS